MGSLPEIPASAIIIVGAGCAALILVLSTILLYFCCKKPTQYKEMGRQSTSQSRPASVPQYQTSDGKPYALVPPHPSAAAAAAAASSPATVEAGGGKIDSRRSSVQKEDPMETSADRRSTVFATLRSAHNPLDSSTSNPALFNYTAEDYADDNRNTDPYGFEGHYHSRSKRIVYEVVV